MKERPSLHALALFLATVEHGTMTAAAEAEGIAQPAISVHVRNLERFYGTALMERAGRRVRATAAGEVVAAHTRRLLGMTDELGQAIADLEGLQGGRLIVGASATVAETCLPEVLGRFRRAHPAVELEVRLGNSEFVLHEVRDRSLAFGIIGKAEDDPLLVSRPVFADALALFAAVDHPAHKRERPRLADLSDETFVLRETGSATRELTVACLATRGVRPASIIQLGSNEAVKRAVAAGLGVGILSARTVDVDARAGDVAIIPCADWDCRRQFWLVQRRDRLASRAEKAFLSLL